MSTKFNVYPPSILISKDLQQFNFDQYAFYTKNFQGRSYIHLKKFDLLNAFLNIFGLGKNDPKILNIIDYFKACLKVNEFSPAKIKKTLNEELKNLNTKYYYRKLVNIKHADAKNGWNALTQKIKNNIQFLLMHHFNCTSTEVKQFNNIIDQPQDILEASQKSKVEKEMIRKSQIEEEVASPNNTPNFIVRKEVKKLTIHNSTSHTITMLSEIGKIYPLVNGKYVKFPDNTCMSFDTNVEEIKVSELKTTNKKKPLIFFVRYPKDLKFYNYQVYLSSPNQEVQYFPPLSLDEAKKKIALIHDQILNINGTNNSFFFKIDPKLNGHLKFLSQIDYILNLRIPSFHKVISLPSGKKIAFLSYDSTISIESPPNEGDGPYLPGRSPNGPPCLTFFPIFINGQKLRFSDDNACCVLHATRDFPGKTLITFFSLDVDKENGYSKPFSFIPSTK